MVLSIEYSLKGVPSHLIFGGIIGLALGLGVTGLLGWVIAPLFSHKLDSLLPWRLIFLLTLGYLGLVTGQKLAKEFAGGKVDTKASDSNSASDKILDTSVIIDGRIADLVETVFWKGFLFSRSLYSKSSSTLRILPIQ